MQQVTQEQVVAAVQSVGIQPGDGLLVHSAIHFLGQPVSGVGMHYRALCQVLGIDSGHEAYADPAAGTLVVPTFNFAFARGERYDPKVTTSEGMGSLSEYVRTRPEAIRTPHPMHSLAVVGFHAKDLASLDTPCAFDPGSVFERMLELDFKLLLLGADIQAVAMLHYCEQRVEVPYRYWKAFTGAYNTPQGWETRTYRMFVRDMVIDPHIELYPVQETLQEQGLWTTSSLNYGYISACRLVDFVASTLAFLVKDPWSLVINPPADV